MEYGFKIKQLILTGGKVEPRVLKFNDGLNLLTGPSNTGKTYVFQCIDFVFGKSKLPKKITESKGYEDIFIEIEEYSSQKISTISRSLINKVAFFYPNTAYTAVAQTNP
ncbi:ATP-binding protein, partial [Listeria innocua]|uniref:AAA family ATPase n=2 Tax=Listeria TaxID=1637 RepID=UPI001AE1AAD9